MCHTDIIHWNVILQLSELTLSVDTSITGIDDNFTKEVDIRGAKDENLTLLPNTQLFPTIQPLIIFREWIFPNSLKFLCSGVLTGWIFRADNITITSENNLPLWVVYNKITESNSQSFNLREGSGNITGVTKIADGVFQYSLQSPVQVEEGDVVGINYQEFPLINTNPLLLSFLDAGSGVDGPVSYMWQLRAMSFFIGSNGEDFEPFVSTNIRYTPLVSPIMSKYLDQV